MSIKMSDVFNLPLQRAVNERVVIDKNDTVVAFADDHFGSEDARNCFVEAVNEYDSMRERIAFLEKEKTELLEVLYSMRREVLHNFLDKIESLGELSK